MSHHPAGVSQDAVSPNVRAPSGASAARSATNEQALRVLIVDDRVLMRSGLRAVVERSPDMRVVGEAASGEEAVAAARTCQPDVVIIDLDLPGAEGLAATRTITEQEPHPAVLAITAHSEEEHLLDAFRAGASGYLTNDLTAQELESALRGLAAGDVYVRPHGASLLAATFRRPDHPPVVDEARAQYERLSEREQLVLRLLAEGYSGPEIGRRLGIRAKTVDTYRQRIHQKIGLAHRTEYIRFALHLDLLPK